MAVVEPAGRQPDHLAGGDQLGGHVRQFELQRLEGFQLAAELLALAHVAPAGVERGLRRAQRAGRDIDPPAVQAFHGDRKPLAFLAEPVGGRYANVFESDGARGLAVPAHLGFLAPVADALAVCRHGESADPGRPGLAGTRHHHQQVGIARAGDEALAAVQHIGIAVALGLRLQRTRVRTGPRLGQTIRGQLFARGQLAAPLVAHVVTAERGHHPGRHVVDADIGRGRRAAGGQRLEDHRAVESGQTETPLRLRRIQPAEPEFAGLGDHVTRKNRFRIPFRGLGRECFTREVLGRFTQGDLGVVEFEIHVDLARL